MKIAIVGAGKLGSKVAEALLGGDHSVTIIDKNDETLHKLASHMDIMTVTANPKQISVLESLGIESYDYLLAATDRDEKNIVIASIAKKLGGKVHLKQWHFYQRESITFRIFREQISCTE